MIAAVVISMRREPTSTHIPIGVALDRENYKVGDSINITVTGWSSGGGSSTVRVIGYWAGSDKTAFEDAVTLTANGSNPQILTAKKTVTAPKPPSSGTELWVNAIGSSAVGPAICWVE